ncbi:hypothetical protein ACTGYT_06835 [Streptococcus suis]
MKKKITNGIILLSAAILLTACGKETTPATSTKTSEKTEQISSSKKATDNSTKKKTDTSSSQATESSATTTTSSQAESSSSSNQTKQEEIASQPSSTTMTGDQLLALPSVALPTELVGTWTGTSPQARMVEVTVAADGTFTVTQDFRQSEDEEVTDWNVQHRTAVITDLISPKPNHYLVRKSTGDGVALLPGVTGIGGAGGQLLPGFILENGQYKVIMQGVSTNPAFPTTIDLTAPAQIMATLNKEQ